MAVTPATAISVLLPPIPQQSHGPIQVPPSLFHPPGQDGDDADAFSHLSDDKTSSGGGGIRTSVSSSPYPPLGPVLSRIVTNRSVIIPRQKRRGLLGALALVPEIEDPYEYSRAVKKGITLVVALSAAAAPMASGVLLPALSDISQELGASQTTTNLSVALYMLGMGIFPLWWSNFAERVGYRTIYLVSFSMYVVSNVCCAVSVNIGMFIAFRLCSGATAASAQSIGAGSIASIWSVRERGRAMGFFYLGPLMGPLLSPIIGGALTDAFGWRSTMWFLAVFGAAMVVVMVLFLPETFRKRESSVVVREKAGEEEMQKTVSRGVQPLKKASQWVVTAKILLVDPLRALVFMKFPPVLITVYWASFAYGVVYILNVSIQKTFAEAPYSFPTLSIGLLYIPNSLGYILASVLGGNWNDIVMRRAAKRRQQEAGEEDAPLEYRPEDRMGINAYIAGMLFPLALLWYGWTVEKGTFWFVPMIATFTFGVGSMLVFSASTTMLTEFVPQRSASAVAVNNLFRNICSCVGGAITEPIIQAIGNGWLFTILCGVGLASCSIVWIMQRYGPQWRQRAKDGEYPFL